SRTYQLKYDPKREDHFDVAKREEPRFWRSPSLRKLTAEQVIDSIRVATSQRLEDKARLYRSMKSTALSRTLGRPSSRNEISTAPATKPADEDVVWLDDDLPPEARVNGTSAEKSWKWAGHPDPVFSGFRSHVSAAPEGGGNLQHLVLGANPAFEVKSGEDLIY